MRVLALLVAALALAAPAGAADREVRFGDAFRLEAADPGPFDRLADGRLACLSDTCVGRTVSVGGVTVHVIPRVTPQQVKAAKPAYRAPTELAGAGDSSAATLLFIGAALIALLAAVLVAVELRRRRTDAPVDRLARALRLVRESATRETDDRRRALDHLAATLGDAPPAEEAIHLAWARPEPEPDATRAVADGVAR